MLLGFGYLYKFDVLFIYFFFKKQKIEKKAGWPKFCNFVFVQNRVDRARRPTN